MAAYRILSLDGGGIRGLYTAVLLQRLARQHRTLLDSVDLIAGTSTGGIIALGLAHGLAPGRLVRLYRTKARDIFDDSWLDNLIDLGRLRGAQYDNDNLKKVLQDLFGSRKRLKGLGKKVLIPSFDLDNEGRDGHVRVWKPKFFHNFSDSDSDSDSDGEELVVDVALRTSAAPTYFPTYQGYVDGGVVANNPSMAALAQALDGDTGNQELIDIRLLSLGTGLNPTHITGQHLDWGFAQWAKPLIQLMIDGVMGVADYQCKRLLGTQYHRLAPVLPRPIALDDWKHVDDIIRYANRVGISKTVRWLRSNW